MKNYGTLLPMRPAVRPRPCDSTNKTSHSRDPTKHRNGLAAIGTELWRTCTQCVPVSWGTNLSAQRPTSLWDHTHAHAHTHTHTHMGQTDGSLLIYDAYRLLGNSHISHDALLYNAIQYDNQIYYKISMTTTMMQTLCDVIRASVIELEYIITGMIKWA